MNLPLLRGLDPTSWETGLSPENARVCWQEAVDALDDLDVAPVEGTPPKRVLLIASANVFTVALPWMALLSVRGVPLRVKAARGLARGTEEMARAFEQVEVVDWRGGDSEGLKRSLEGADAVMAFGRQETLDALKERLPAGVRLLGFGPRFSVGVTEETEVRSAVDLSRYDSRGCMSPAGWFTPKADLDRLAIAMAEAQERWPRGALLPEEASAIRARMALARAVGQVRQGKNWAVLHLPGSFFSTVALPRVLQVYEDPSVLLPHRSRLSTVASMGFSIPSPRSCLPGRMQCPPATRWHDGMDVLSALWGAPVEEWAG